MKIKVLPQLQLIIPTPPDSIFNVGFSVSLPVQFAMADTNTGKLPSNCVADHGA